VAQPRAPWAEACPQLTGTALEHVVIVRESITCSVGSAADVLTAAQQVKLLLGEMRSAGSLFGILNFLIKAGLCVLGLVY
jgi:hypothetical protein